MPAWARARAQEDVKAGLCELAEAHGADLLLVGHAHPSRLRKTFTTSTASHLAHYAPCPTLIIPYKHLGLEPAASDALPEGDAGRAEQRRRRRRRRRPPRVRRPAGCRAGAARVQCAPSPCSACGAALFAASSPGGCDPSATLHGSATGAEQGCCSCVSCVQAPPLHAMCARGCSVHARTIKGVLGCRRATAAKCTTSTSARTKT